MLEKDTNLQEIARVPADAEQGVQEAQVGQDSADGGVTDLGQLGCEQLHYHIVTVGLQKPNKVSQGHRKMRSSHSTFL